MLRDTMAAVFGARRSRMAMKLALGLLALSVVGCAHDLPGWKLASTQHFSMYTDVGRRTYGSVLDRLEEVHAGLASSFFDASIPPLEVFLFSAGEFHELLGPIGGFFKGRRGRDGILVIYDGWDPKFIDEVAAHELAHGFINATFRSCPVWFNEGFAVYTESIKVMEDKVWFGSVNVDVGGDARGGYLAPVAELFAARSSEFHGGWERRNYTTAWAMIHYLWHGEDKRLRKRFDQLGNALAQGGRAPGASARAWAAVYPDIPLAEIDDRLRGHLQRAFAQPRATLVGFQLVRPPPAPVQLAPADMRYVNEVRAELRKRRRPDKL